jgi:hypothetical protein
MEQISRDAALFRSLAVASAARDGFVDGHEENKSDMRDLICESRNKATPLVIWLTRHGKRRHRAVCRSGTGAVWCRRAGY